MPQSWDDTASIIIPTYYRNELLEEAIESALAQESHPVEVIVVDDSGEAYAESVVSSYEDVSYIPLEENIGENPARDRGLDVATGRYIQFLDDDDILREDKISKQIGKLDDDTGVIYSGLRYYESGEIFLPDPNVRGNVIEETLKFSMWPPCFTTTLLIDRSVLEPLRPLRFHGAGDTSIMIDLAQRTNFDFVNAPLVEKRLDVDSLGFTLENIANKRALLEEHRDLYAQYPACRDAALTHINHNEAHIRLHETAWTPRATLAFLRAARHTHDNSTSLYLLALFSCIGQPGVRLWKLGTTFAESCQVDGPTAALSRTRKYLIR